MQTTPWRRNNCRDPRCSSSTTGDRPPLLGLFQTNLEILAYSFSGIITAKFLWQIAARTVSNKEKVPKGSCGIPLLKVLLQVMTK